MNRSILAVATIVLLMLTPHTGDAAEPIQDLATPEAAASASLIARAGRALREYVAACSTDDEALAHIVTGDAMVEYALAKPGTYLQVEAAALCANRPDGTLQTNTVFVNYTIDFDVRSPSELPDSEHLALLEMRGDEIAKLRHFGTLSTSEAFLLARAIASARASTHD